jgi:hypothetical protein
MQEDGYDEPESLNEETRRLIEQDAIEGKTVEDILVEEMLVLIDIGYQNGLNDEDIERLVARVQESLAAQNRRKFKLL